MSFDIELIHHFNRLFKAVQHRLGKLSENVNILLLLCVDPNEPPPTLILKWDESGGNSHLKQIETWVSRDDSTLDGIYLEYDSQILGSDSFKDRVAKLCERYVVGFWNIKPDSLAVCADLVKLGARFCNTDLPRTFLCREDTSKRRDG